METNDHGLSLESAGAGVVVVAAGPAICAHEAPLAWYYFPPVNAMRLAHFHCFWCRPVTQVTQAAPVMITPPCTRGTQARTYNMVFRQHNDAPPEFKQKWHDLLEMCAYQPRGLIDGWLDKLRTPEEWQDYPSSSLPRKPDLVQLDRTEGGIGGNSNISCRQMRFCRSMYSYELHKSRREPYWTGRDYSEIRLIAIPSSDGTDVWAVDELEVYRDAFGEVITGYLGSGHEARIEVVV